MDNDTKNLLISYKTLRIMIGLSGMALPIILPLAAYFGSEQAVFLDSISDYYQSHNARDFFVGILFALAFFLLSYKGYETHDNIVANLGGIFAIGVALLPNQCWICAVSNFHFISAGLLFSVFIYFALFLFTLSDEPKNKRTNQKIIRNRFYRVCGFLIFACILLIAISKPVFGQTAKEDYNLVFWFEAIALWSFGISWLVKGEVIFGDATDDLDDDN